MLDKELTETAANSNNDVARKSLQKKHEIAEKKE
jgi:hypothetical protein